MRSKQALLRVWYRERKIKKESIGSEFIDAIRLKIAYEFALAEISQRYMHTHITFSPVRAKCTGNCIMTESVGLKLVNIRNRSGNKEINSLLTAVVTEL